eukprot:TRINITY_DN1279_c2_g1_i1.p1 TRINITY_DN1279_c2_g1~~TRINITY_DN1279_c2_g1_i1.p1  ORF type:complete len:262 (+),score=56.30 TRINITY_DN1279_c2_g1_i1:44-829(+)
MMGMHPAVGLGMGEGKLFHDHTETFKPEPAVIIHEDRVYEDLGTTIMACVTKEGVILASDGKTSRGRLITCLDAPKITKISDKIFTLRCGNAAHTQQICRIIPKYIQLLEIQLGTDPPVATAARLFQLVCRNNNISAALIIAGWDKFKGGQVYSVNSDGCKLQSSFALNGSGSTLIYSWMDATFKEGMSEEEAKEWAIKGISLAKSRDISSGGCTRVVTINADKVTEEILPWSESVFKLEDDDKYKVMMVKPEPFPATISE